MDDWKAETRHDALYEEDYFAWSRDQAKRLRALRPAGFDWENVAEEIESLGRSDKRSIASDLNVVLVHLLKWMLQPEKRKADWRGSIVEHRDRIAGLIEESPSLRRHPAEVLAREYRSARLKAAGEMGRDETAVPIDCPFTIAQVLDPDFWPEAGG